VARSCKHENGISYTMKGRKFLDQLSDYYLTKEDFPTPQQCEVSVQKSLTFGCIF
jgi:hypothetical protein